MGKKQNRKRARRQRARSNPFDFGLPPPGVDGWAGPTVLDRDTEITSVEDDDMIMALFDRRRTATAVKSCGTCREFIEDGEFGRGTCLHPGSGVFSPWDNTPACDFYSGRRR
jgi:hypothetical protein